MSSLTQMDLASLTGDIGYYDNSGKIFFSYRMREVLKVDNYWFRPEEILGLFRNKTRKNGQKLKFAALQMLTFLALDITGKIYFVEKIPHNPQGKKLRGEIKNFVKQT